MLPSLIFPLCLWQVKWHCKAVIIEVLCSGVFQELQSWLEKSPIPTLSSSQCSSCSSSSRMISWLAGCPLCLLSGVKPADVHNMLSWTWDLCGFFRRKKNLLRRFCLVQGQEGTAAGAPALEENWCDIPARCQSWQLHSSSHLAAESKGSAEDPGLAQLWHCCCTFQRLKTWSATISR